MNNSIPTPNPRAPRSRHSYRDAIREVILARLERGEPLHIRKVLQEAGGGSVTTVQEEITALTGSAEKRKVLLIGRGASTVQARVAALEAAIDEGLSREGRLQAQVAVIQEELVRSRDTVDRLLLRHDDVHRQLLQAVDDLRQMARAAPAAPAAVVEPPPRSVPAPVAEPVAILRQRCNQLAEQVFRLEETNRALLSRLHENGIDP